MYRVGQGFDVHRLDPERKLVLCGVEIPHKHGLLGHSDADVAVHALIDALLGALALGDIGEWFPDTDQSWKDVRSIDLLAKVLTHEHFAVYGIMNLDITIIAQEPRLRPYIAQMKTNLAEILDCAPDRVSVKATTTELLGFCGRGEGIAASAVVLLGK